MIPILYEKDETAFVSNGLGRLRDCISCIVTEERNGIYECDFEYPITGANYDLIQLGRIVGVTHDDTGDVQPFDIVSFSKPIDGVVTFHCVHISYRQSYMTVTLSNISHISTALMRLNSAEPSNPFSYWTDKSSTGYLASADSTPRSVRQMLGGIEGSILDTYGGEYEWDKFLVKLWNQRGQERNFTIRYGVNMLTYDDDTDSQGAYSSCVPYWSDSTETVVGNRVDSFGSTVTGRGECVPLDLSDKFEDKPTAAQLESMAASIMNSKNTFLPTQTIKVSFVRLQDMSEYQNYSSLLQCGLCDTVKVVFPDYGTEGRFKIVKTVWDVLGDRYENMELGTLSTTLAEALGITNGLGGGGGSESEADYIEDQGTDGIWTYRKWHSGIGECWGKRNSTAASSGTTTVSQALPSFFITETPVVSVFGTQAGNTGSYFTAMSVSGSSGAYKVNYTYPGWAGGNSVNYIRAIGRWK